MPDTLHSFKALLAEPLRRTAMSPSLASLGCLAVLWLITLNMMTPTQGLTEIFIGELHIVITL